MSAIEERADESVQSKGQFDADFHGCSAIKLLSYHSALLRILRLVSLIPCLLLINHTTLDCRR